MEQSQAARIRKHALTVGMGYFALNAVWALYNTAMPHFYREYLSNLTLVGLIMTFDNILALTVAPFWGAASDRTRTAYGRRLPFIFYGMPVAALFVALLPIWSTISLWVLLAGTICMNLSMVTFRAPMASLFADLFPPAVRTQQSGLADVLSGLGAVFALLAGGALLDVDRRYPFLVVAVFLIVAGFGMRFGIREPAVDAVEESQAGDLPPTVPQALKAIATMRQRSPLYFMLGMFFVFMAWNGLETWWSTFAVEVLQFSRSKASDFAAIFGGCFILGAYPAGVAAARFGRKPAIRAGVLGAACLYTAGLGLALLWPAELPFAVLLALTGFTMPLILVNGLILFQEFANVRQVGLFTGLYALATAAAQIAGPPLYGAVMEFLGAGSLWGAGVLSLLAGLVFINRIEEGQVHYEERTLPGAV